MNYAVHLTESAAGQFDALPKRIQRQVGKKLASLGSNPRNTNVIKLKGEANIYRLRSGDYRVIFEIDDKAGRVVVSGIYDRKDAYS
jgi:mRNA interferase RelE/StbE